MQLNPPFNLRQIKVKNGGERYEDDKVTEEGGWEMKKIQNKLFSVEFKSAYIIYIYDLVGKGGQIKSLSLSASFSQ